MVGSVTERPGEGEGCEDLGRPWRRPDRGCRKALSACKESRQACVIRSRDGCVLRIRWLGGRDSNSDTAVQRATPRPRYAPTNTVSCCSSQRLVRQLPFVFDVFTRKLSHRVSATRQCLSILVNTTRLSRPMT